MITPSNSIKYLSHLDLFHVTLNQKHTLLEVRNTFPILFHLKFQKPFLKMHFRKVRVNFNCSVVIAQRKIIFTLFLVSNSSGHEYVSVSLDEKEDFVETVDGLFKLIKLKIDDSNVKTTDLKILVKTQCLRIKRNCLIWEINIIGTTLNKCYFRPVLKNNTFLEPQTSIFLIFLQFFFNVR